MQQPNKENLDITRNAAYTTARSDIAELVPSFSIKILDIGCSNGSLGRALKAMNPVRTVYGIEIDQEFIAEAKKYLDFVIKTDINKENWIENLGNNKFDCIIFADVLEHLISPELCLSESLKILTPSGCIIVSLPNIRHLSALTSIFLHGRFPHRDRGIFDRTHLRWFTIDDAENLITSNGLKISEMDQALRWGDTGGGWFNRQLNRLPSFLKKQWLVREFLTYQAVYRAEIKR